MREDLDLKAQGNFLEILRASKLINSSAANLTEFQISLNLRPPTAHQLSERYAGLNQPEIKPVR